MTIAEIISKVDALKPNQYETEQKINWLSQLDSQIFTDVLSTHEDSKLTTFTPYTEDSAELIVGTPYDGIYTSWLEAMIDKANGDVNRYNNSSADFNGYLQAYKCNYNKTHMPKYTGKMHF